MQGTVKWFSSEKGYGFITSVDGEDHYFNVRSINGVELPSNGDQVTYDSKPGQKGPRASNVEIILKAPPKKSGHIDDRITCPSCGKKIVPRMITYRGDPEKSVCPYCATTIKTFSDCFIATAVYGNPSCHEVRSLREFRDRTLRKSTLGRFFIIFYYLVSPVIANNLVNMPKLSNFIRSIVNLLVGFITIR